MTGMRAGVEKFHCHKKAAANCFWDGDWCRDAYPFIVNERSDCRAVVTAAPTARTLEQYTDGDQGSEDYTCYIWVPVKK